MKVLFFGDNLTILGYTSPRKVLLSFFDEAQRMQPRIDRLQLFANQFTEFEGNGDGGEAISILATAFANAPADAVPGMRKALNEHYGLVYGLDKQGTTSFSLGIHETEEEFEKAKSLYMVVHNMAHMPGPHDV